MAIRKTQGSSTLGTLPNSKAAKTEVKNTGRSATALYTYLERTLKSDRMRRTLHDGAVKYENETGLVEAAVEKTGGRRA